MQIFIYSVKNLFFCDQTSRRDAQIVLILGH